MHISLASDRAQAMPPIAYFGPRGDDEDDSDDGYEEDTGTERDWNDPDDFDPETAEPEDDGRCPECGGKGYCVCDMK